MDINPFYEYHPIEEADKYVNSLNDLVNKRLWGETPTNVNDSSFNVDVLSDLDKKYWGKKITQEDIQPADFGLRVNKFAEPFIATGIEGWGFSLPEGVVVEKIEFGLGELSKIIYLKEEKEMTQKSQSRFAAGDKVVYLILGNTCK